VDTLYEGEKTIVRQLNDKGIPDGTYKVISEFGEIAEKGNYKNGKKEGKWYYYSYAVCHACEERDKKDVENNWVMATIKYRNDLKDGECWFQLGELHGEEFKAKHDICYGFYKAGKQNDTWTLHTVFEDAVYGAQIAWFKFEQGRLTGPGKISQSLSLQGMVLPYESFLDSLPVRLVSSDNSYAEGIFISGERTGTWKYYTAGGNFHKQEKYENGNGTVEKEVAITTISINDLSLKRIKYMDVSADSTHLLLATSGWKDNAKIWIFRISDGALLRKGEIAVEYVNSVCFLPGFNDVLCVYNYIDGVSYHFDLTQNKVIDKVKGSCEKFYDISYNIKDDLRKYKLSSLNDLAISKPNWYNFEEIFHFNEYLGIQLTADSVNAPESVRIDLASGKVEFVPTGNAKAYAEMIRTDLAAKYETKEGMLLKKEIEEHSVSDFSFNGAYGKCMKNGRKIYELDDIIADIGKYINTWSFFMPGKSEKKHFNFAYENKLSYVDRREDFGHVYFWNGNLADKKERSVRLNITQNRKFIFYTPDMYYYGSSNLDNIIYFEQNLKLYPFEQFDLKYNRPDIILRRLGYSDSLTIATFHKAYLKRLKKMHFTEDMLKEDFHLPEIKIENPDAFPVLTDSSAIELHLHMKDAKYDLDRINVYINNVPVYGANGINLREEHAQELSKQIKIELAKGMNKIQVSVLNQAGAESYKETLSITCNYKSSGATAQKPDLYLVSIGDSRYKDSRYDLSYAAKDAEDITATFAANTSYNKVFSFMYADEKVTRENILALKKELLKARRDDIVIITVAGHGVLDKNLDYYLATYDMDFEDPAGKGIPYEQLESLVDSIAPLRKVIFIDACHSGEIEKEEMEQLAAADQSNSEVKFRTAGSGIQKKHVGMKSTGELMGELFTDLRKGTGATVVSSAGGAQYAMESAQWKNGLFTYCMLHGLKDKAADANKDGKIMLSELQNYLRTEVSKLSKGAQQPTSRIENLSMDFRLW
jgi:uncharacterized caspase-like protein/WD40 repeat protein